MVGNRLPLGLDGKGSARVSLVEVAARSGVSVSTASRALNPDSRHPVSASTRLRVAEVAAELGFRPNSLARSFQLRRTKTIGVLIHDVRDAYFSEFARAASDAAQGAGYLTVICSTDRDPERELRYVEMMVDNRVAGLLLVGGGLEDRAYERGMRSLLGDLAAYGGVAVALGPRAGRMPAELPDNIGGARQAAEHLLEIGHRRIALIDGPAALRTSKERRRGFQLALEGAGVRPDPALLVPGSYTMEGGAKAMAQLLALANPPTAVFASNDAMAIGGLNELRRRGVSVPDDMSVVGFDDIPMAALWDPPLTTVSVSMAAIGAAGVARIIRILNGSDSGQRAVIHPTELVVRASTAPSRRGL